MTTNHWDIQGPVDLPNKDIITDFTAVVDLNLIVKVFVFYLLFNQLQVFWSLVKYLEES